MDEKQTNLTLIYGMDPASVFVTENPESPEINNLDLNIANPEQAPPRKLININRLTPEDDLPSMDESEKDYQLSWFFVWFPWGSGKGDMATANAGNNIAVSPAPDNQNWYCKKKTSDKIGTYWILFPREDMVLAPQESVSFLITNLISATVPGMSYIYIQNKGILDYEDESRNERIWKYERVSISSLTAIPDPAVYKDGGAEVQIQWKADNFTSLMLVPFYQDVTKAKSYGAQLKKTEIITLVATGKGEENTATKSVTAAVLPSVNSFSGIPDAVFYKDFPHDIRLNWDVETEQNIYLVNNRDKETLEEPPSGTLLKSISHPQMWTLYPEDPSLYFSLRRNVLINGFKLLGTDRQLGYTPSGVSTSPNFEFIALGDTRENCVVLLNALTFERFGEPAVLGSGPGALCFSTGGTHLFAALPGAGAIAVIPCDDSGSGFETPVQIPVDGTPRALCPSLDDCYLFISVDAGEGKTGSLVILKNNNGVYEDFQTVPVGKTPAGIDVSPSGARVYVTNSTDDTLSVVGYDTISQKFAFTRNIRGLDKKPVDVAVGGKNGETLLVTCQNTNRVVVMDHDDRGGSPRQELAVGRTPGAITTSPDLSNAFVLNSGDGSLTLIGCYRGVGGCKVLESSMATCASPAAISLTEDGSMGFVSGSGGVTEFSLIQYELEDQPVDFRKALTDVAVTSDGRFAVAWFSKLANVSGVSGPNGIHIYDTASGTITDKLPEYGIIKFASHPDKSLSKGAVIAAKEGSILLVETKTFEILKQVLIPEGSGGPVYPLDMSLSADGRTLFLLARDKTGNHSLVIFKWDTDADTLSQVSQINIFTAAQSSNITLVANTPDASHCFVVNGVGRQLFVVRKKNDAYGLVKDPLTLNGIGNGLVASPDNRFLYLLAKEGMRCGFSVLDIEHLGLKNLPTPASYADINNLQRMVISPDGRKLFVTDADIAGVRVFDPSTFRIVQTMAWHKQMQFPMGIAIRPDASGLLLVGLYSQNLALVSQVREQPST